MSNKDFDTTTKKLRTRAYWRLELHPSTEQSVPLGRLSECRDLVKESSVQFRGWDVPHVPVSEDEQQAIYPKDGRYEAWIDWHIFKEVWRMYPSGEFVFLAGLTSQWYDEYDGFGANPLPDLEPEMVVDIIEVIYTITEFLAFVHNIAHKLKTVEEWNIQLSLNNVEGRKLQLLDRSRIPLRGEYVSHSINIPAIDAKLSRDDLLNKEKYLNTAKGGIESIFELFGWDASPVLIDGEQEKLINKRFF